MILPLDALAALLRKKRPFAKLAQELCSYLRKNFSHYNWVGIYLIEDETLVLRAWDGPQATEHVRIPIGEGICGLAAREERSVVVDDVNKDPRYLQCFLHTRSEIVVPIFAKGKVVGEIDIDGDTVSSYNETDRILLEWCADRLGRAFVSSRRSRR